MQQAQHQLISDLYCRGVDVPPERFRQWALDELRALLPFDAAVWGSGTVARPHFHNVTVVGVPESFAQRLEDTQAMNPLLPEIRARLGEPVAMSDVCKDRDFYASPLYRETFAPFGIERILSSGSIQPRSGLYTLLSIYRFDRRQKFSAAEKAFHAQMLFHLIHASSQAFFMAISRPPARDRREWSALCDDEGMFHEVETEFMDLLESAYPTWRGQRLPFEMPPLGFEGLLQGLYLRVEALGDLKLLHLREAVPLDALTTRERDVVTQVCEGLSAKAIGRNLGLAPSTVSTHLYRAYRKLGVESRTKLAHLMRQWRGLA